MEIPPAVYLRAVEQAFLVARGRGLMLSSQDVERVLRWQAAGYPLHVVVDAVQACVANASARIRGLSYVAPAVDEAVGAWRSRRIGGREPGPPVAEDPAGPSDAGATGPAEVQAAFGDLLGRLDEAAARQAEPAYRALIALARDGVAAARDRCQARPALDPLAALEAVGLEVEAEALEALGPQVRAVLETRVDLALASERRLARPEAFAQTRRAQLWRAVRQRIGLPALVLALDLAVDRDGGAP